MALLRFDDFELDLGRMELRHKGVALGLPRVPMNLLVLLLEKNGDLVTRQEIAESLWPGSDPADIFQSINNAINRIRYTLRDNNPDRRIVETVVGRGYRFAPAVERVETETASIPASTEQKLGGKQVLERVRPQEGVARGVRNWVLAAGFAAVFAIIWRQHMHPHAAAPVLKVTRIVAKSASNPVSTATLSPEGNLIAFSDEDGPKLQSLQDSTRHPLRAPKNVVTSHLAWMPDGLHLVQSGVDQTSNSAQIWMLSTIGDAPVLLRDRAAFGVPSPDGTRLAFLSQDVNEVWTVNLSGGDARKIWVGEAGTRIVTMLWSANRRFLLLQKQVAVGRTELTPFGRQMGLTFNASYTAIDASTGKVTASISDVWMEDACLEGRDLVYVQPPGRSDPSQLSSLHRVRLDPTTGGFAAVPTGIGEFPARITGLSFSARAKTFSVVAREASPHVFTGELQWPGPTLESVKSLTTDLAQAYPHGWTRDGQSVLFESDQTGRNQVYRQRLDQLDSVAIAPGAGAQTGPRMTADGRWILYIADVHTLLRAPAGGGASTARFFFENGGSFRCAALTPVCMISSEGKSGRENFAVLHIEDGGSHEEFEAPLSWGPVRDWDISADASQVIILSVAFGGPPALHLVDLPAGRISAIPLKNDLDVTAVNWIPRRSGWLLGARTIRGGSLFYLDKTGKATALRQTQVNTYGVPSPDARRIAFVDLDVQGSIWLLKP